MYGVSIIFNMCYVQVRDYKGGQSVGKSKLSCHFRPTVHFYHAIVCGTKVSNLIRKSERPVLVNIKLKL